ncbi:serine protease FAM111A isoform X1 [Erythrolamprus reginae]|uniref:serine protease FAM111A isoform X1 n=1 Tax=Erythrolamprus reginae TaxID=121349 RepID=UPI00396CCF00
MELLKEDSVAGTSDEIPKIKEEVQMNDEYDVPRMEVSCMDASKEERTFTVTFTGSGKKHQVRGKLTDSLLSALTSSKYICDWMNGKKSAKEFHLIEKKDSWPVCFNMGMPLKYVSDGSQFEMKFYKVAKKENSDEIWYRHYDDRKEDCVVFYVNGIASRMESHGAQTRRIIKNSSLLNEYCTFCIFAPRGESIKDALCNDGRFLPLLKEMNWTLVKDGISIDNDFLVATLSNEVYEIEVESKKGARYSGDLNKKRNDSDFGGWKLSTLEKPQPQPQPDFEEGQLSASKILQPEPDCEQGELSASKKQQPELDCEQGQLSVSKKQQQQVLALCLYPNLWKEIQNMKKLLTDNKKNVLQVYKRNFGKEINDSLPFTSVKNAAKYGGSVGYIEWRNGAATCFVLRGRYILTCHHVIKLIVGEGIEAEDWGNRIKHSAQVTFTYEEKQCPIENWFSLENWFEIADEDLDFAVLKLEENKSSPPPGLLQLNFPPPPNGPIFIIGHPNGGVKSVDNCLVVSIFERGKAFRDRLQQDQKNEHCHSVCGYRPEERCIHMYHPKFFEEGSSNPNVVTYNTCFLEGSSGSPVFNRKGELVALHAAGFAYKMKNKECSVIEIGYSIHSIISKIESKFKSWYDAVIGPDAREDSSHVDASLSEAREEMDCT